MTNEDDLTIGINHHGMWHTLGTILLTAVRLGSVVVDWSLPVFSLYVFDNSVGGLIDTDANDLNLITPCSSMRGEHLLIVSHWLLAWWTPSSPEVNKPDLALGMLKSNRVTSLDWHNVLDCIILATW